MLIDKLPWVEHGGDQVFSVHVQPGGARFATAGSDHRAKVWNLVPALDARAEQRAGVPRLLASLADHNGPVNVVRFSPAAPGAPRRLATGSDDGAAHVYELRPGPGGGALGGEASVENWRLRAQLRGHASHVVDVAWSPDGARLATAGLDAAALVWDAATGARLASLPHGSFVKGVAWDPVGSYLATASEDGSLGIWRADDFRRAASVRGPFERMVTSTYALRLGWSPDGGALLAGNSYQGATHAAAAVPRGRWGEPGEFSLVCGHGGAVVAAAFSPRLFRLPPSAAAAAAAAAAGGGGAGAPAADCSPLFALGGQDGRLTVWAAGRERALFAGRRLFKGQVVDVAWTPGGAALLACSTDGTVACLRFERGEVGEPVPAEELAAMMAAVYGSAAGRAAGRRALAESAEQLQLEAAARGGDDAAAAAAAAANGTGAGGAAAGRPPLAPRRLMPAPAAADPMATLAARLGGPAAPGAVTQTGFGDAAAGGSGGAVADAPPRGAKPRGAAAAMPPPPARPPVSPEPAAKRQRAEAAPLAAATAALLAAPPVRPEFRVALGAPPPPPLAGGAPPRRELRVVNRSAAAPGSAGAAEVALLVGGAPAWTAALAGYSVIAAVGTPRFVAAATSDGHLVLWTPAGRQRTGELALGAGAARLAAGRGAAAGRLLALTTCGRVVVLDTERLECVLDAPLAPLLGAGRAALLDASLSAAGLPLLALADGRTYAWHAGLRCWTCAADAAAAAAGSAFAPALAPPGAGELAALQAAAGAAAGAAARPPPGAAAGAAAAAARAAGRAHAERALAAAEALGSPEELRRWLTTYARCLADASDEGRLKELCYSLIGPAGEEELDGGEPSGALAAAGPPAWAPRVLGLAKRELLRSAVLPAAAHNRALGGLLQRVRQALDDVERRTA